MKKFFGIVFTIIGALWTLVFLFVFTAEDATALFVSIAFVVAGIITIVIGIKMVKGKKHVSEQSSKATAKQPYMSSQPQPKSQTQQEEQTSTHLTLKDIHELTAQKIENVPLTGGLVSALELATILNKMNDPKLPFVFNASKVNGIDMIAHWKLADIDYVGLLGLNKHDIQASFDVLMKFDEQNKILRCKDKLYKKQASFGFGGIGMETSTFSGKSTSAQKEIVIGRKKDGSIGKVVDISLDTTILQNAIKAVAEKNGWEVKRVVGRL